MPPVLLVIIIIPGAILPLYWMRRLYAHDRLISLRVLSRGVISHIVLCASLGLLCSFNTLALYCGALLILIGISHCPAFQSETHQRMRQAKPEIAKLQRLLAQMPDHSGMHLALGNACYDDRQFAAAITEYETAAKLNPELQRAVKGKLKNARFAQSEQEDFHFPLGRWLKKIVRASSSGKRNSKRFREFLK
jgi:cytochrome c-type biogenesis protein CcmH/NrfG